MAHVLIMTVGPAQELIAAARRCRDLWFGSWMLSELCKAVAASVAAEHGAAALIFPGVESAADLAAGSDTTVTNKIVARLPEAADPAAVALRGRKALDERLRQLLAEVLGTDRGQGRVQDTLPGGPYLDRPAAEQQVASMVECLWVAVAEEPRENPYPAALEEAEDLLAARWSTLLWDAEVPWARESVPKSSLDGARESVLHERLYAGIGSRWTADDVRRLYGVGPTERLCGPGLLKRHGRRARSPHSHHFLSTGHLAAWPLLERLAALGDAPQLAAAWRRFLDVLAGQGVDLRELEAYGDSAAPLPVVGRYDGGLLFEGRLGELFESVPDPEARRESIRQARAALLRVLEQAGVPTPLPYYAVLVADGDHMGLVIREQETHERHRSLSQALGAFQRTAHAVVERDHHGELIYAGGDDVLAFVPLHRAVSCARALAADFRSSLSPFAGETPAPTPTLSVGIGISHFLEPMGAALQVARRAERLAKQSRDALAVIVNKRSGPEVRVCGRWGSLDADLEAFVTLHGEDAVPDGAAFDLETLARLLDGAAAGGAAPLERLVEKEAERILRRKQPQHGAARELTEEVLLRLLESLGEVGVGELAGRLIVARLLAVARRQSQPEQQRAGGER